jgi:hypothetical protein
MTKENHSLPVIKVEVGYLVSYVELCFGLRIRIGRIYYSELQFGNLHKPKGNSYDYMRFYSLG